MKTRKPKQPKPLKELQNVENADGHDVFPGVKVFEIGKLRHEGVKKATKVHAIPLCRIHFTSKMLDGDHFI